MAQVPDVTDGLGTVARFASCTGIAIDSSGNLFVADTANSTIRKITPGAEVSTFAGSAGVIGASDGVGTSALFYNPISIAIDSANNLYVADNLNSNIRKVTPAGVVTTLAGMAETIGWVDGNGSAALFNQPNGIAIDGAGNVYVADTGNSTVRKITPAGTVTTLAGLAGAVGAADGPAASARFNRPLGVAADGYGNVFVADSGNFAVREIANSGAVATVVGVLGQKGIQQGPVPASLTYLYGIAISGNALYLTTGSAVLTVNPFY
jgi:sugar lactone lactonase YvrE